MAGKMRFDKDKYVPVYKRVEAFRLDYPNGVIITERTDITEALVTFKARVFRTVEEAQALATHGLSAATGHSEIEVKDPKDISKCETSAVGRALGMLGYEIQKGIASAEEMEGVEVEEEEAPRGRRSRKGNNNEGESGLRSRQPSNRQKQEYREQDRYDEHDEYDDEGYEEEPPPPRRSARKERAPSRSRISQERFQ